MGVGAKALTTAVLRGGQSGSAVSVDAQPNSSDGLLFARGKTSEAATIAVGNEVRSKSARRTTLWPVAAAVPWCDTAWQAMKRIAGSRRYRNGVVMARLLRFDPYLYPAAHSQAKWWIFDN